ncbi:arginase family protein [uncultured Lactobacillus sp.]|uniref:arginase family protein n=1 Tax=uncultured Lactobacillus sp. TaxID=153152 RepID=UPI002805B1AF|nr:arginase family protein [uncultured Lactobacillus sp.]
MNKTIRLVVPDWQAGDNPVYELGAKVLKAIAPENKNQPTITVDVPESKQPLPIENGVTGQSDVLKTIQNTKAAIEKEKPTKIITFGGNCLVSQQPIDYLNGIYGDKLGVIWLDAHPDISNPEVFGNEHAMVLGNLLHQGDPVIQKEVDHPLKPSQIYHVGLQEITPEEADLLKKAGVNYQDKQGSKIDTEKVREWIKENDFKFIFIHLDIDILDPNNFYSTYFNNPELGEVPENAAKGKVARSDVWHFISQFSKEYNLVGLTLAEYLPWSAKQMLDLMKSTDIFK